MNETKMLPDDDAIENKIQEWLAEEGMNTYSEEYLAGFESAAQLSAEWMRSLAEKTSRQDAIDFMNWREEKYVLCDKEMYHEKWKSENLKLHTSALYALFITEKYRESCK